MAKLSKSRVRDKGTKGIALIFGDTRISLNSVGYVEGSFCDKNQPDSSVRFYRTL